MTNSENLAKDAQSARVIWGGWSVVVCWTPMPSWPTLLDKMVRMAAILDLELLTPCWSISQLDLH